jgi:hypothetical protein
VVVVVMFACRWRQVPAVETYVSPLLAAAAAPEIAQLLLVQYPVPQYRLRVLVTGTTVAVQALALAQ